MIGFLRYLLKNGRLKTPITNFESKADRVINSITTLEPRPGKKSQYQKLRDSLMKVPVLNTLIGNAAYIKSGKKKVIQFFVVSSQKLVYVRILKSASTSVLSELLPLIDKNLKNMRLTNEQIDVLAAQYATRKLHAHEHNYNYFAVIRNPFSRLVSVYLDLFDSTAPDFAYSEFLFGILNKNMSFEEFVKVLAKVPDSLKGPHFSPQSFIISNTGIENKITCFRLEKDEEALATFLKQYGIAIPHLNRQEKGYDYRIFYTGELADLAYNIYKEDVQKFGYEQDYQSLIEFTGNK
jgi:hypothetical protein